MKIAILIFSISFLFFCCDSKQSGSLGLSANLNYEGNEIKTVEIDKRLEWDTLAQIDKLSDLLEVVEVINLEDSPLIGEIGMAVFHNSKYYLLDEKNNNGIYVFGEDGKLIWYTENEGEGPLEYLEIIDFAFVNNDLWALDNGNRKLIKYDANSGKAMDEIKIPFFAFEIEVVDSCQIVMYSGNTKYNEDIDHKFLYFDVCKKELSGKAIAIVPIEGEHRNRSLGYNIAQKGYNNKVYFSEEYGQERMELFSDSIVIAPDYFYNLMETDYSRSEILSFHKNKIKDIFAGKSQSISNFLELKNHFLFISIVDDHYDTHLYNKETHNIKNLSKINDDLFLRTIQLHPFFYKDSTHVINYLHPFLLVDLEEKFMESIPKEYEKFLNLTSTPQVFLKEVLKSGVDKGDNPYLVISKIK